jgi:hypothetical protein
MKHAIRSLDSIQPISLHRRAKATKVIGDSYRHCDVHRSWLKSLFDRFASLQRC